jgi:two-component system chemotaxis response regulator CheB
MTVRVVVADDSPFVCRLLTSYLQSSAGFQVVGSALDGAGAVEAVKELHPDVVTLDLEMPGMDGLETLERIMHECPTPVVLVTGVSRRAADVTLRAIDVGAVDFILKYTPGLDMNPEMLRREIIAKVRAASQIRVVRSLGPHRFQRRENRGEPAPPAAHSPTAPEAGQVEIPSHPPGGVVVIGASTGGPVALRELLSNLPADFATPIVIVQHMPASFTGVLAAQLDRQVPLKVRETEAGDRLQPGLALVAPGDYHLLLRPGLRVELNQGTEIGGQRPCIDVTMQSAAQIYGARTKGVLLTGMGDDGTRGLVSIRAKGGQTFAQDAASCAVNGMPRRAVEKGVVDHVAPPARIAQMLR